VVLDQLPATFYVHDEVTRVREHSCRDRGENLAVAYHRHVAGWERCSINDYLRAPLENPMPLIVKVSGVVGLVTNAIVGLDSTICNARNCPDIRA